VARKRFDHSVTYRLLGVVLALVALVVMVNPSIGVRDAGVDSPSVDAPSIDSAIALDSLPLSTDVVTSSSVGTSGDGSKESSSGKRSVSGVPNSPRVPATTEVGKGDEKNESPVSPAEGNESSSSAIQDQEEQDPIRIVRVQPLTTTTIGRSTSATASTNASTTTTLPRSQATTTTTIGPNDVLLRIPLGTMSRIHSGDPVDDVMPPLLQVRLGQTLVLVNDDSVFHVYGPFSVRPGEAVRWRFVETGDTVGYCTVGPSKQITIRVVA